jgi:hypothetical protein
MKKTLIGLLALGSLSSFGNTYKDMNFYCEVSGDQRGLNSSLVNYNKLKFSLSAVEIVGQRKLENLRISNLSKSVLKERIARISKKECRKNRETCKKDENGSYIILKYSEMVDLGFTPFQINRIENVITYFGGESGYRISFNEVSAPDLEQLIESLGGEVQITLPNGLNNKTIIRNTPMQRNAELVHQVHFPLELNDGESYHIKIYCREGLESVVFSHETTLSFE